MSSETSMVSSLPRWDVSEYFPAVDSPEFRAAVEALAARVTRVRERVDALGIRRQDSVPVTPETVAAFDEVTTDLNGIGDDTRIGPACTCAQDLSRCLPCRTARP